VKPTKIIITFLFFIIISTISYGDDNHQKNLLKCNNISKEDLRLDKQYKEVTSKMEKIINRYKIHENKNIQTFPYQVEYSRGNDFIKLEKYTMKKSPYDMTRILSVHKKSITIFIKNNKITKLIANIYKKDYESSNTINLTLIDNSPTSGFTKGILITQNINGNYTLKDKKLKDFRNTSASPIRNELKRNFLINHIEQFNNYIVFIGERFDSTKKDNEQNVTNFLRTEARY